MVTQVIYRYNCSFFPSSIVCTVGSLKHLKINIKKVNTSTVCMHEFKALSKFGSKITNSRNFEKSLPACWLKLRYVFHS